MAELHVMGSGDAFGSGGRMQTCFWIKWEGNNFLIDCGATSSVSIKKNRHKIENIDAIFISHLHGDHIGGIPFILMELAYLVKGQDHKIIIYGPNGVKKRLRDLQEILYPGSLQYTDKITDIREYSGQDDYLEFRIETYDVRHSELSVPKGLRISCKEKVFSFSGDGEWSDELLNVSKLADLFICECYNFENSTPGHLNYILLKEKLPLLTCKKIMLNHPGPELLKNLVKVDTPFIQDSQIIEF